MLLWAFNPDNPYGYYILLRFMLCGTCAYLAFHASEIKSDKWVWILGVTAVIYNPILRIHLTREIWSVINIATIIILVITFSVLRTQRTSKQEGEHTDER